MSLSVDVADLARLQEAAFDRERRLARRLIRTDGLSPIAAMRQVLTEIAAPGTLDDLLTLRLAQRDVHAERRAVRQEAARDHYARKQNRVLSDPGAWQGWFDGSAVPNPGRLGIGGLLRSPDGAEFRISRFAGEGDGNIAEYLALIALLEIAVQQGVAHLVVQGDSQVVIGDVQGTVPVRTGEMDDLRTVAQALLDQVNVVELVWVPRARNRAADALARSGLERILDSASDQQNDQNDHEQTGDAARTVTPAPAVIP